MPYNLSPDYLFLYFLQQTQLSYLALVYLKPMRDPGTYKIKSRSFTVASSTSLLLAWISAPTHLVPLSQVSTGATFAEHTPTLCFSDCMIPPDLNIRLQYSHLLQLHSKTYSNYDAGHLPEHPPQSAVLSSEVRSFVSPSPRSPQSPAVTVRYFFALLDSLSLRPRNLTPRLTLSRHYAELTHNTYTLSTKL